MILQEFFQNKESCHKVFSQKKMRSCCSFLPVFSRLCLQYCQKKCVEPSVLTFPEKKGSQFIFYGADKYHFLWSLMRVWFGLRFHNQFQDGLASRYLYATIFLFWEQPLDIEIKWKEKEKFKNSVLLMVILHTVTKYIHVFSQRYSHLGLCDILIKVALLQRDLSTKPLVEKCTIEALEHTSWYMKQS